MKVSNRLILVIILVITAGCTQKTSTTTEQDTAADIAKSYTMADFKSLRKIDTHVHLNTDSKTMINLARANNFRLLNISVDVPDFPPMEEQVAIRAKHYRENPELMAFGTAFTHYKAGTNQTGQIVLSTS